MSPIGEGWMAVGTILLCAALPTEIWRWLGLVLGRNINPQGEVLNLVRAVATGIIAAFVAHAVMFPSGSLASVPLYIRLIAVGAGVAAYAVTGQRIFVGAALTVVTLVIGLALIGF